MASTTRWIIDTAFTSVTFTGSELNSLASGGAALSTAAIANGTNFDQMMDVSFVVTVGGTTVTGGYVTVFLLPLNQDGSTYGDSYVSSSSAQPSAGYGVGSIGAKVGITSGNTITGTVQFINIPPGDFKLAFGNNLQVTLSSTAALTLKYRTYNTNLNA